MSRYAPILGVVIAVSCAQPQGAYTDHADASDFDPVDWDGGGKADFGGVPAVFDPNDVMEDSVFVTAAVDGDAVQQFLETSPYGSRSWLADVQIGGQRFSDAVVAAAAASGIDPVLLLVRAQVESSLVSRTPTSQARIDKALGCGCADGSACSSNDAGVANQLACAADVFATRFDGSQNGTGLWISGHARKTQDGVTVTPRNNATAALYAYTPWVLTGQGGNWLVWNVTRRFLKQFDAAGTLQLP